MGTHYATSGLHLCTNASGQPHPVYDENARSIAAQIALAERGLRRYQP